MLKRDDTVVAIVDFQGKLARIVRDSEAVLQAAARLIRGAKVLEVPVVWTEQNPAGLGPTVPEVAELLEGQAIAKLSFSCCAEPRFADALKRLARKDVLLAGIETHICVYQTAAELLAAGYAVHVVADAVSSRTSANKAIGLAKMERAGAHVTSVETALFELQRIAEGPTFKELLRIVK